MGGGGGCISTPTVYMGLYWDTLPTLVAQLDVRSTGDQKVAGSTPTSSATFFRGD